MREFGVLSKWGQRGVLLPGLLVVHSMVGVAVVVWGRAGFERVRAVPGARMAVAIVALFAVVGLGLELWRRLAIHERLAIGIGSLVPCSWFAANLLAVDYDRIAATFSATALGESGDGLWFPGLPLVALGYTAALAAYAWVCVLCVSTWALRSRGTLVWLLWSLCGVSFAFVVHFATGW